MPRVIVTGGPGAGETTLVSHLAAAGYATVHDSARAIIAETLARGLSRRPEPQEFAREILRRDIDSYHRCAETGDWVFFDRGVIEGIAMVHETAPLPLGDLQNLLSAYTKSPAFWRRSEPHTCCRHWPRVEADTGAAGLCAHRVGSPGSLTG